MILTAYGLQTSGSNSEIADLDSRDIRLAFCDEYKMSRITYSMGMLTLCRIAREGSSSTASTMHTVKMRTHTLKIKIPSGNYQNGQNQKDRLTIYNSHIKGEHGGKLGWRARTRRDTCNLLAL